ncbi:MAG: hypothetical protein HYU51_08555 [Candidatus Rokubacteria bacterium]|nr:hypothetical protein [Candidatus Rokubacteria bacterium]
MSISWVVWLVAVYMSLDVSNPMMPGALTFGIDESVEVRQADRFRAHDAAARLPLAPAPKRLEPVERPVIVTRASAPDVPRIRRSRLEYPRPAVSTPTASPEDD